jgi:pimeloyl-ACP methyl ester carboxylesterase
MLAVWALLVLGAAAPPAQAAARAQSTKVTFQRISVTVQGKGPDVVLIPGLGGSPEVWSGTTRRLKGRARVHLVQVAGFAGAPAGANAEGPVLAPVAEEIAAYLRSRGLTKPKLIGHSTGGKLALMVAARHPDLPGEIMVVDMLPFFGLAVNPAAKTSTDILPIARAAQQGVLRADASRFEAEQTAAAERYARSAMSRAAALRGVLASDRRTYAQAMHDLISTDLRPELANIKAPVTVLYASTDVIVGFPARDVGATYRASYAGLPTVRLIPVPDSSHMIMDDQPARLAQEIDAFLRD